MESKDFFRAIEKYAISGDITNVNKVEIFNFNFREQSIGIKIFELTVDDKIMYDFSVSHYLMIKGNLAPYKHTSGPQMSPFDALVEALITLFHLLQGKKASYEWVKNQRYEEI